MERAMGIEPMSECWEDLAGTNIIEKTDGHIAESAERVLLSES
jgi:hypothetical protein